MSGEAPWRETVRLAEAARGPLTRRLVADAPARSRIAGALGLDRLDRLEADVRLEPWLDGAGIEADWSADIGQTCGVTLEPFESRLQGRFHLRVLPSGSPNAEAAEAGQELTLTLEDEDPPDLVEGGLIDLGDYVVEHLALEIDPFPRKPGAVFEPLEPEPGDSPFAALARLSPKPKDG